LIAITSSYFDTEWVSSIKSGRLPLLRREKTLYGSAYPEGCANYELNESGPPSGSPSATYM